MLGGLSGGGMVFWVSDKVTNRNEIVSEVMNNAYENYKERFDFITKPLIYNFTINNKGTYSTIK